jgi:TetR/AcrR family transcriptional regulator, cholesterol catabolism regulator
MTTKVARKKQPNGNGGDASANARRALIMREAAHLFGSRGFDATTIRDIAAAAGILGGSIYYHFESKEDIFLAVHSAGMESITNAVIAAIEEHDDPWDQLEAAAIAHCNALLATGELPVIVSPYYSESLKSLRSKLVAQRDQYDKIIADIINRLDLPEHINRHIFRLHFLGALNWMPTWYRPNSGLSAAEIGRQLVAMVKHRTD